METFVARNCTHTRTNEESIQTTRWWKYPTRLQAGIVAETNARCSWICNHASNNNKISLECFKTTICLNSTSIFVCTSSILVAHYTRTLDPEFFGRKECLPQHGLSLSLPRKHHATKENRFTHFTEIKLRIASNLSVFSFGDNLIKWISIVSVASNLDFPPSCPRFFGEWIASYHWDSMALGM